jgi:hypothetical protein
MARCHPQSAHLSDILAPDITAQKSIAEFKPSEMRDPV